VAVVAEAPGSLGRLYLPENDQRAVELVVMSEAVAADTQLILTSDAASVAAVVNTPQVGAGTRTATLEIATGPAGVAELTLRGGGEVHLLSVVVGEPAAEVLPPTVAGPVAVKTLAPPSLGRVVLPPGASRPLLVRIFDDPVTQDTVIEVTSTDPTIAEAVQPVICLAGSRDAALSIQAGASGTAVLTLRSGDTVRRLVVVVGYPPTDELAPVVAPPVQVEVLAVPSSGTIILPEGGSGVLSIPFLPEPAGEDLTIGVDSSGPWVAQVPGPVIIPAGGTEAVFSVVATGPGTATIRLVLGEVQRRLVVIVGPVPAEAVPPTTAPAVGVEVLE
jgi:hypothetical protein